MTIKIAMIARDTISQDAMSERRKTDKKNKKNSFFLRAEDESHY